MELSSQWLAGVAARPPVWVGTGGIVLTGQVTQEAVFTSGDGTKRTIPGGKHWAVYHGLKNRIEGALLDRDQSIAIAQTGDWLLYACSGGGGDWAVFCRNRETGEERPIQHIDGVAWLRDVSADGVVFGGVKGREGSHTPAFWERHASEPTIPTDALGGAALGFTPDGLYLVCQVLPSGDQPGGVAMVARDGSIWGQRFDLQAHRYTQDGWLCGTSHEESAPILVRATSPDLLVPPSIAEISLAGEGDVYDAAGDYAVGGSHDGQPAIWSILGKRRLHTQDLEDVSRRFRLHALNRVYAADPAPGAGFHAAGLSESLDEGAWKLDPAPGSRIVLVSR